MPVSFRALVLGAACLALSGFSVAGQTPAAAAQSGPALTLGEALRLAKARNGTVQAALYDVRAAGARVGQALSVFYPQVTANYTYNSSRQEIISGGRTASITNIGGTTLLSSNLRLFDSGERVYNLRATEKSREASRASARQTLRTVLFNVVSQYYDALRNQELQRVSEAQVNRTAEILNSTLARINVGAAAPIERLQANADLQNARVNALTAKNRVTTAGAVLKGTLGLETASALPVLQDEGEGDKIVPPENLAAIAQEGITNRPDLILRRRNIESLRYSQLRAERQSGLTFALDYSFNEQLTPDYLNNRGLIFSAGFPLFDGGQRREAAREIRYNTQAERFDLVQAERAARAEIESAFYELRQNAERLDAARIARDAARENYTAAIGSQRAGAYDLIQVLTAQVSLVTAEANYIQAIYDAKISQVRLNLTTGRPVPGE